MLSPRYLEGLSDEIVEIYAQLEADILQDMARRIARLGTVTEATKWQAQLLAETGALKKNVNRLLKKYDPEIQKEIKAIYNDALIKNARADNRIFTEALGHGVSDINAQVMLASIQKTHSDLSRLTITTAYTTEQQFVQQANAVYMQVVTGAFDYDSAMKNACNKLASDGITGVQYMNGKPVRRSIEAAVRMNILTGVNQTASAMTMSNCEELGCDLVETTAHIGARPSHEEWQGQIFSLSGTNPKYRPFSVCQLGEPDGICGINCRHSYYPYFEGLERHYTQSDLDEMENVTVEYNGQKMSRYDAEQELRGIERNIRKYKRQALTQAAGGVDNTHAREMIGKWQATARDFTQQTKLERDGVREFIGTKDGKQPRAIFADTPAPIQKGNISNSALNKAIALSNQPAQSSISIYGEIYNIKAMTGNIKNISDIKTMDNMAEYVKEKYNAQITQSVVELNLNTCKKILTGIDNIKKDFPLFQIDIIATADHGDIASYSMGTLTLNPAYFNKSKKEINELMRQYAGNVFVRHATMESCGAHEGAHGIEWALIKLNKYYTNESERIAAWGGHDNPSLEAVKIVNRAVRNLLTKATEGTTRTKLIKDISIYALDNASDTLAEAFADVCANGKNARPLSLEIKRITMLLYNNYLKGEYTW